MGPASRQSFQGTLNNPNSRQAADLDGSDLFYAAFRPVLGLPHPTLDLALGAGLGVMPGVVVSPFVPPLVPPAVPLLLR